MCVYTNANNTSSTSYSNLWNGKSLFQSKLSNLTSTKTKKTENQKTKKNAISDLNTSIVKFIYSVFGKSV